MKKLLFTLYLSMLFFQMQAQENDINNYYEVGEVEEIIETKKVDQTETPKKFSEKINLSMELGTVFSPNGYSGQYMSPSFQYNHTPRFGLEAGVIVSNNLLNKTAQLQCYTYVGGNYKITDRLTVNGSVLMNTSSLVKQNTNDFNKNNQQTKIMSFGAEYKFSENFSIGVQFQSNQSPNPYSPYGFGNNMLSHQFPQW